MLGIHQNRRLFLHSSFKTIMIGMVLGIALVGTVFSGTVSAATVYTDRLDYPPGDSVIISGFDFADDETVRVRITHVDGNTPGTADYDPWNVIAGSTGSFETFWNVPEDALGETLLVTATGLTSGLVAVATFSDCNSVLYITEELGTYCPGGTASFCAVLYEKCPGGGLAPLPNRPIIFFLKAGNCGASVGQNGFDTVWTDANGTACATATIPAAPGTYSLRVKYLGERKPNSNQPPNSACNPTKRIELSAANDCDELVVNSSACNQPPVASCPGDTTVFMCTLGPVTIPGFNCTDPDNDLQSCNVSLGTLSGGSVTFTPTAAGSYTIRLIATDEHGAADTCQTIVTVNTNHQPVCNLPSNATYFVCGDTTFSFPVSATDVDGNLTGCTKTSGPGTLTGGNWVFTTTAAGTYIANFTCTDACGATCNGTVTITVNYDRAPVATCPGNQTKFVCDLSPITINGFSAGDPDGNLTSTTVDNGTLNGTQVTFTPVAGANVITLTATDACGVVSTCQTTITVSLNNAPVATCPGNQTRFVCDLSPITIDDFTASDADGNLTSTTVDNGTLNGTQVTFTPVAGANVITLTATDACGVVSTCQTTITVSLNNAPVATCPGNQTKFVCDLSPITIDGFTAGDPDGNLTSATVNNGTLNGTQVTFTPVAGANVITLTATDACGVVSTCQTTITVSLNNAPVATCPGNETRFVCDLSPITIDGFTAGDPDGNLTSATVNNGTLNGTQVTFTPVIGANVITLTATDACGVVSTCQTTVTVNLNHAPAVICAGNVTLFRCDLSEITLAGFGCSDEDGNLISCTVNNGTLNGDEVTFTPVEGINSITLTAVDACGEITSATCQTTVTVILNRPPTVTVPEDDTLLLSTPQLLCYPISVGDPDYPTYQNMPTASLISTPGTLANDTICFTPVAGVDSTYWFVIQVVDSCTAPPKGGNASVIDSFSVTVRFNQPPVVQCAPNDTVGFACTPSQICVNGFSAGDPDNSIVSQTVSLGVLSGATVCFTPDTAGLYTIVYTATDALGASSQCETHVLVQYTNLPPVANCHGDTAMFVCTLAPITLGGFNCSDPDGNLASCAATGGTLNGNQVTFTPVVGVNTITLTATDACGLTSSCQTQVTVTLNNAPVATCPGNVTLFRCDMSDITLSGFGCTDQDGNLTTCTVDNGTLVGDQVTFSPMEYVTTITLTATDACGATSTCQTTVTIIENQVPTVDLPNNDSKFLCTTQELCYPMTIADPDYPQYQGLPAVYLVRGPGTIIDNVLCFTPEAGKDTTYWFVIEVCDSCGVLIKPTPASPINSCIVDSFSVTVAFNVPPVAGCPAYDTAVFDCGPSQICVGPFTGSDADNNITGESVSFGVLAGGQVCFTPDTAGVYTIVYTVTDACGASDQCETKITVQYANQPPVATCPGDQAKTVCDLSQICLDGFSCVDPDDNLSSCTVIGGTLNGNTVCFTPVVGINTIKLIATDVCGLADTCMTTVTVNVIPPPQLSDTVRTAAMCAPGQTCVGLPQVTGGRPPFVWQFNGQTVTGQICFNLNDDSLITGSVKVTDSCGRTDIATLVFNAVVNTAPVVTVAVTSPQFLCQTGGQVCAKLTIVDPDNTLSGTSTIGTVKLSDSTVCFAADTAGHYCNTVIISDSCGLKDTVSYCVDVNLNHAPVCQLPGDTIYTLCETKQVCRPISATDADGNLVGCEIVDGPGSIINGNWCYTPAASGSVDVTIKCTDQCGAFCEGNFTATFNVDRPPVVTCHDDTSFVMPALQEICLTGFECSDPDGDLVSCTSNRGPINGGQVCFLPEEGLNTVIIEAEDACGRIASCTTRVWVVVVRECPVVRLEKTEGTLQGHTANLELTIENAGLFQVAGFDFLIAYDASALTFIQAEKGDLLTGCGWEYFTYRFGPDGNCGSGCPTGMLRLIAMAETNNGPSHPSCYGPSDLGVHGLADLTFLVSNDRTLECQYVPVYFYWLNCGDNAVSNIDGDSLIIDSKIFNFEGGIIWDELDDSGYPDDDRLPFTGAGDTCLVGFKVTPYRCLEFWNGGVDIVCADSIDARGDINLNGIANEVADAVMLTNYFINGLAVFPVAEGSIAASDVNADGIALSVADLVYLVRVIVGDAAPYAKPLPDAGFAVETHAVDAGLEVEYDASSMVGAVLLTFDVDGSCGTPILGAGAAGMDMASSIRGNELRVLVYNIGTRGITAGNNTLMTIPGEGITLISAEAADYYGGAMATSTRAIPTEYDLAQNYPNPFNPTTAIKLNLATPAEWTISIFNVAGQKVREYTGRSDAGTVEVVWDAADVDGNRVASGIYLYRATAGSYSATKKMVLMK